MNEEYEYEDEDEDEDIEEGEVVFEADEALILALNEIHSLKELIEEQQSAISELRDELISIRKDKQS
jgi:hypothetical protein